MSLASGTRLGSYEILSAIGAGGMGEVYRARDSRLKRDVAIKILPAALALDRDRLDRFEREAQLLASLNHPHIAAIYGLEESDGIRALVLELVEGETLEDRLRRGPMPCAEAVGVATQMALAIEAAHDRGIIHRDLKPANVKLMPDGTVKVLDFGLAKALDPASDGPAGSNPLDHSPTMSVGGTRAGVLLGTAAYMSPEQARGLTLDTRTDIWSFGCVLFELVTGRLAFPGETITDILSAVVSKEPDWSALPGETPDSVRRVLRRCLTKDVKRRLRHIGDARLDLDDTTISTPEAAPRGRRREYLAWTTAAVLLVALGVALSGRFRTASSIVGGAPAVSRFVRLTSGSAHESAPAISPDSKWVAYLSNARGVTDVWVKYIAGGDPVNLTASLNLSLQTQSDLGGLGIAPDGTAIAFDAQVPGTAPPAYSSWVIPAPLGGVPRKFVVNGRAVRWSPDGTKIVYVVAGGSGGDALWVADADGGNPREIAPRRGGIHKHWPAWSGDGRFVYFNNSISTSNVEPAELYRVLAAGGAIEPVVRTARRAVFPALMPDGSGMIYGANPDTADLGLWWKSLIRPDAQAERLTRGVGEYSEPSIAADGGTVVTTLVEVRQALLRLPSAGAGDTWSPTSLTSGFTGDLDPVLSPAGDRLVFSSTRTGNRNLWTSRADGTEVRPLTSGTAIDERPAVSPDGQRIAFLSDRGGRRGIWVMDADGGSARLLAHADVLDSISWSRDGSKIVFAVPGDEPHLETVNVADRVVRPLNTPGPAAAPAWSPAADVVAYFESVPGSPGRSISQAVAFVDGNGRPVHQPIQAPYLGNGQIAWDATGKRFALVGNSGAAASAVWIFDPEGRQPPRRVAECPHDIRLRGVTWTQDGQSVIVGQLRRTGDIVLFELARRP